MMHNENSENGHIRLRNIEERTAKIHNKVTLSKITELLPDLSLMQCKIQAVDH